MEPVPESREWLRVTLSSIGDAVITTDAHGRITFLNPVAEKLTGWTQDQATSKSLEDVFRIVNEDTRATVENPAQRALREGVVVGLANHTMLIARDGTERPIDDSAAPIRNNRGEVAGVVLVFRDVTERRTMERTLHDSEMRYRRLFQSAKDGILILDAQTGKIIDANAYMAGMLGVDSRELLGKELWQIGVFKDIDENKHAFRRLQTEGYIRYEHLPLQNKRGETVEVEFISNLYQEDHHFVAQCNVRNIVERRLKEQAQALADENRRKDEFLAMLSHELRNPLSPIQSAARLLRLQERPGNENPIQKQAREVIERQVAHLSHLVNDLLEVSRVISGRLRVELQVLDLRETVQEALKTVQPLLEERRHKIALTLPDEPVWVHADPTRMEEVIVNLLNNACKYTKDDGAGRLSVTLTTESGPQMEELDRAVIHVRDNGDGIDGELLPRLFDLFSQGKRTLDRAQGGLGIGLTLAHRLLQLQSGTLEARSDGPGKGSEFIVRLPMMRAAALPVVPPPAEEPPENGAGLRVLVVDDNIDSAVMLASLLRHAGYSVQTAYTGPDALKVALQWRPDVALLDIGLPEISGYEVARRVRTDPTLGDAARRMRLIALTGYGREADFALAREAGFDAHLVKPIDFDEVEKLIAAPLGAK